MSTSGAVPLMPVTQSLPEEKLQDDLNSSQALKLTVWSTRLLLMGRGGVVELGCGEGAVALGCGRRGMLGE